jgi:hypothetical protein
LLRLGFIFGLYSFRFGPQSSCLIQLRTIGLFRVGSNPIALNSLMQDFMI